MDIVEEKKAQFRNNPPTRKSDKQLYCSFCAKSFDEVLCVIEGPNPFIICDECTELCFEIIKEAQKPREDTSEDRVPSRSNMTDREATSASILIGHDCETHNPVEIGERERRSGLYVLGKPRMGKSTLFVNMIAQDIEQGRSVFFLDPHGQAITDLFERYPSVRNALQQRSIYLLDPTDDDYSFGLNPLFCPDVTNLTTRRRTYDKAFSIFKRIWENENQRGVWLERILQSVLPIFIELQEYTLAEMPLFLNDPAFRSHVLRKVKHNIDLLDYWQYEYEEKQAQSARNRVGSLLSDERVRHIIGQLKPTIDFEQIVKSETPQFVFLRLPTNLSDPAKHFLITDYPQPRNDGTNREHMVCFCEFERWRATRSSFKKASVRLSLPICTEPRISAAKR
jgi:hypothetical protein